MIADTYIRTAHAGDADEIARIHVESWRAAYQGLLPQSYLRNLDHRRITRSMLEGLLDSETVFLIADGSRGAIGYISGGSDRVRHSIYTGEIYELYLLPDSQKQGLGRRLVSALARRLYERSLYSMQVWVLAGNPNRRFYEKVGGLYIDRKIISFAERKLDAVAYGWIDITLAVREHW